MSHLAILLLALISVSAPSEFSERQSAAEAIKKSAEGQQYATTVDSYFLKAFMSCRQPNADPKSCPIPFLLVASIDKSGQITEIVAKPSTPTSECFKANLSRFALPPPPAPLVGPSGFPVSFSVGANLAP